MENFKKDSTYLYVISGPMLSGKSTALINILNHGSMSNLKCVYFNSAIDTRSKEIFSCHNPNIKIRDEVDKFKIEKIEDLFNRDNYDLEKYHIIGIDEAQFFGDLMSILKIMEMKKFIVVAGLETNFKQQPFGKLGELIGHCNKHEKVIGFCMICSKMGKINQAIYSIINPEYKNDEIFNSGGDICVGDKQYIPVCFEHR